MIFLLDIDHMPKSCLNSTQMAMNPVDGDADFKLLPTEKQIKVIVANRC